MIPNSDHKTAVTTLSGRIVAVRGNVVDLEFPEVLPAIHTLVHSGTDGDVGIEITSHLNERQVRGIALNTTAGLHRDQPAWTDGRPLMAPVGENLLGRMFNVFGEPIDGQPAPAGLHRRSVHQSPIELARRVTSQEVFFTGIKAIDLLVPLERGGKAGLFGGAGVGKTVLIMELIQNMVSRLSRE